MVQLRTKSDKKIFEHAHEFYKNKATSNIAYNQVNSTSFNITEYLKPILFCENILYEIAGMIMNADLKCLGLSNDN